MDIEEKPNLPPTPATLGAIAPANGESFDSIQRQRAIECPTCGISFYIPFLFFLRKSESRDAISCPNHHQFVPETCPETIANANGVILLTELLDAMNRIKELEKIIAEKNLPLGWSRNHEGFIPATGDMEELKRRARILAKRMPRSHVRNPGHLECSLCGREIAPSYIVLHLIRRHADKIAEMPSGDFQ